MCFGPREFLPLANSSNNLEITSLENINRFLDNFGSQTDNRFPSAIPFKLGVEDIWLKCIKRKLYLQVMNKED